MLVERLTERDYEEALAVLNASFAKNGVPADFEQNLPIMWTREKDYMRLHFGIREGGRLVALLGVYPLPVRVAGRELLFSTVGNVGTLPEARGKGCMKALMDAAMQELDRIGADASRLGGLRSRYNRFGYDHCGSRYGFLLTARNAAEHPARPLTFHALGRNDDDLAFARRCHERLPMYAVRPTQTDFYMTLCAWGCRPFLARDASGAPVGYLSAAPGSTSVAEQGTVGSLSAVELLTAWRDAQELPEVRFQLAPFELRDVDAALRVCEGWSVADPSMFRIVHWDKVADAFLALRAQMAREAGGALSDGLVRLGIEDWGVLELEVRGGCTRAARTDAPAELRLDRLAAARRLFGPVPPAANPGWFPLPLSWNGQDRV